MGTKLKFSTAFHPQTDGQSERTNQVLEDMLRACVLDFKGSWIQYLPLIEFAYNNSYQATIECHLTRHSTDEDASRPYIGMILGNDNYLDLRCCKILGQGNPHQAEDGRSSESAEELR
ncbi:hypothetical protein SLA2020_275570 [Shorea laevis]